MKLFFFILLLLHLTYAYQTQLRINSTPIFNKFQKRFNSVLTWLVPFLWSLIVRSIIKEAEPNIMTKAKRNRRPGSNSDNWMGLTGGDNSNMVE